MLRLPAPAPASSPLLSFAMGNACGLAGLWQIGSPTPYLTFGWVFAALFAYWRAYRDLRGPLRRGTARRSGGHLEGGNTGTGRPSGSPAPARRPGRPGQGAAKKPRRARKRKGGRR